MLRGFTNGSESTALALVTLARMAATNRDDPTASAVPSSNDSAEDLVDDLPRVLYVGEHQIGTKNSTGVTLADLYTGYPAEKITQLAPSLDGMPQVGHLVPIPRAIAPAVALLAAAARAYVKLRPQGRGSVVIPHNAVRVPQPSFKTRLLVGLSAATDLSPVHLPSRLERSIRHRQPEVIHTIIGRVRTLKIALEVSRTLDIPIVPHVTDDWISTIFTNGELRGFARRRTLQLVDELLQRSPALLVIGETMAEEYTSRYGKPCFVASAGIDPVEFATPYQEGSRPKRLVYVGNPLVGRAAIADQVGAFARTRGWEVIVHPMLAERWKEMSSHVTVDKQLDPSDIPPILQRADALLFPESLDPEIAAYTRLSFSTKAAQLIAAGRPILAIGPKGQGSIEEIRKHASRSYFLNSLDDSVLREAFDYLDNNLDSIRVETPRKYWSSTMRVSLQSALRFATVRGH